LFRYGEGCLRLYHVKRRACAGKSAIIRLNHFHTIADLTLGLLVRSFKIDSFSISFPHMFIDYSL
jgi:hypothetical protein